MVRALLKGKVRDAKAILAEALNLPNPSVDVLVETDAEAGASAADQEAATISCGYGPAIGECTPRAKCPGHALPSFEKGCGAGNTCCGPSRSSDESGCLTINKYSMPVVTSLTEMGVADIKIPVYGPVYLGLDANLALTGQTQNNTGKLDLSISLGVNLKVLDVYAFVMSSTRVSGYLAANKEPGSILNILYTSYNFITWNAIKDVEESIRKTADRSIAELSAGVGNVRKSTLLDLYASGFQKTYIDVPADEWLWITEGTDGAASTDAVVLEQLSRIEKMMATSPTDVPQAEGGVVWKFTDVTWNHPTTWGSSKLWFRLRPGNIWDWSPDGTNWMGLDTTVVRGGEYNGRSPTAENVKLIRALLAIMSGARHPGSLDTPVNLDVGAGSAASDSDPCVGECASAMIRAICETACRTRRAVGDRVRSIWSDASSTLSATGKQLWQHAREVLFRFKQVLAIAGKEAQSSGTYRVLNGLFRQDRPKRPSIIFSELAARMSTEGVGSADVVSRLVAQAVFLADAFFSGDYTRTMSIADALYAFCIRNVPIASEVSIRLSKVMKSLQTKTEAAEESVFRYKVGMPIKPDLQAVRKDNLEAATSRWASKERAILDRVQDVAAQHLYGLVAAEIKTRFDAIFDLTIAARKRLIAAGDKTWGELNEEERAVVRREYFGIRKLTGELHRLLLEINQADSALTKGIVYAFTAMKNSVGRTFGEVARSLKSNLATGCALDFQTEILVGAGLKTSVKPSLELKVRGAAVPAGFAAVVDPVRLDDPSKTYTTNYKGWSGELSGVVGSFGANLQVLRTFYESGAYCKARSGNIACSEAMISLTLDVPMPAVMTDTTVKYAIAAALGANQMFTEAAVTQDTTWTGPLFTLINKIVPLDFAKAHNIPVGTTSDWNSGRKALMSIYKLISAYVFTVTGVTGGNSLRFKVDLRINFGSKVTFQMLQVLPVLRRKFGDAGVDASLVGKILTPLQNRLQASLSKANVPGGPRIIYDAGVGPMFNLLKIFPCLKDKSWNIMGSGDSDTALSTGVSLHSRQSVCERARSVDLKPLAEALAAPHTSELRKKEVMDSLNELESVMHECAKL